MRSAASRSVLVGATAVVLSTIATSARAAPVPLPSVLVQVTLVPPFAAPAAGGETEGGALRFPADSLQRIAVGVDRTGRPFSVRVRQRLVLRRAGDYSFVIGAPAEDVRAAPGSESEPGLREGAVLWAGFSAGRKVLAADVVLRAAASRDFLPLRINVSRSGGAVQVRLRNATRASVQALSGNARPADAAAALDAIRRRGADPTTPPVLVDFPGLPTTARMTIAAPLHVRAQLVFPDGALGGTSIRGGVARGDAVDVDVVLGDSTPLVHDVVVRGVEALPKLRVVATPQAPERMLEPPAGSTWREFVRGRKVAGRALVTRAVAARLAFARARQYQTFLFDPDALGPRSATYSFVTAERPVRVTPVPVVEGETSWWTPLALAAFGLAAAAGLVVLWAHS